MYLHAASTTQIGHGTHCAGNIAAEADNGVGIAGVAGLADDVKIMTCRFMGEDGGGRISDAISCLAYAVDMGAQISSHRFGI